MNVNEFLGGKYLKSTDITRPMTVTIIRCVAEEIRSEPKPKLVMYFREIEKGLVMNATNLKIMMKVTGQNDSDDWVGRQMMLYVKDDIEMSGEIVSGLRLRPLSGSQTSQPTENNNVFTGMEFDPNEFEQ